MDFRAELEKYAGIFNFIQIKKNNESDLVLHFWEASSSKDGGKMQMIKRRLNDGYILA